MKKVLITGASGFVGANLSRRLLQDGHEVHLLLRHNYSDWRIKSILKDVTIHIVNLSDGESLRSFIQTLKPEWIYNLATEGAYSWQNDLNRIVSTNMQGTINLLTACVDQGFEAFVNTGSSSEYGYKDHAPAENEFLDPNSFYAVSKASATLFCRYYALRYHLNISTLRLYSVYGPYEDPRRLIPALILNGCQGKYPLLVNPDIARDFIYVDDVNNAYLLAAKDPEGDYGRVFNVGTGIQTSIKEIVEIAKDYFHITEEPQWGSMEKRNWDTNTWKAAWTKIQAALGWKPAITLPEGFARTAIWFQENRPGIFLNGSG